MNWSLVLQNQLETRLLNFSIKFKIRSYTLISLEPIFCLITYLRGNDDNRKDGVMQNLKLNFKNSVTIDGNRKLKNFSPSNHACCICVINIQMKWPLKCLILSLVASLVFAAAGMIFLSHLRTNS